MKLFFEDIWTLHVWRLNHILLLHVRGFDDATKVDFDDANFASKGKFLHYFSRKHIL